MYLITLVEEEFIGRAGASPPSLDLQRISIISSCKSKMSHIGIVEKAQETSSDSDMHNTVLVPLLYFMNSGCVLECRETPTS